MRVCQFRHFGTGHVSGLISQTGSNFESRKRRPSCQIASLCHASLCQCVSHLRFSASSSSRVRGQSAPNSRDRLRSANTLPPVWQRAQ